MQLISFDPFRTLGLPNVRYIKPERMYDHLDDIKQADWLLFPEYWQVNTLVFGLGKRIFPSLPTYLLGHDKVEQTRVFKACCPEHTPRTAIHGSSPATVKSIVESFSFPIVAKAVKSSMGQGVALLETAQALEQWANEHPVLYIQERLPIDRDIRLVWVGNQLIDAYWRLAPENGFHNNVAQGGTTRRDPIPEAAVKLVRTLAQQLNIDHAGFDVAMVDGHPYLFEFNRLFGNQGIQGGPQRLSIAMLAWLQSQYDDPRTPPGAPTAPMPIAS
ncbi:alpha-L-glutamate ligase [Terasakiispira papahanaumokuakeensis]|uniref:Alpha-L-glutamate ligase n=1 Tax=Terasakiispira papahanaumokuakeensis TaxID=197479 RepID=A0A1E2VEU9_9GAMM|nr:alpha-L-glutamate ligase [Terasakiispira papahanaumokuakeensis]ODC05529.1 alpha-L-glutamate ligase [Terasakiispira papahanaumokuakeensis]